MFFGDDLTGTVFILVVAVAAGGLIFAILFPLFSGSPATSRVKAVANNSRIDGGGKARRNAEENKDSRRKQIQDSLDQVAGKKKRLNLTERLEQAGLEISPRTFILFSAVSGFMLAAGSFVFGAPLWAVGLIGFTGVFGLPRWVLGYLRGRRQNKFLNDFADAIDVLVRGLRSGLPVNEAMKIIATEQGPPVGPEFVEVVEGQRVGITIDQGIERMTQRIPLPEVNFLAIVMAIQSKSGGNLSEALSNLSKVLRDRKKMKQKIRSVSQEAKSSAAIIGSLPFIVCGMMAFFNPNYLAPLFNTSTGHMLLIGSGVWMCIGILIMRKMINFEI
ncbi:type II secretion system F family protein [Aestuariivirga litoralis]|uniref:type II secretion system F family protein n=1 Tax=Aestuariivirga litoralis TaxID=2650924 RepID=UPI0018C66C21|nr:type II secretion system F family protein [Aestuariivirga litoralis]MBG1233958.1 type II secretion system F family protein [Aestuariivirga litoralis]